MLTCCWPRTARTPRPPAPSSPATLISSGSTRGRVRTGRGLPVADGAGGWSRRHQRQRPRHRGTAGAGGMPAGCADRPPDPGRPPWPARPARCALRPGRGVTVTSSLHASRLELTVAVTSARIRDISPPARRDLGTAGRRGAGHRGRPVRGGQGDGERLRRDRGLRSARGAARGQDLAGLPDRRDPPGG